MAENPDAQMPAWFVSHAWIEPIRLFLMCLRRHALLRELERLEAYWVCAYANNQHTLDLAISRNPRKTSFYKAMQLCRGVLLVLDSEATPFTRIWCCFEESIAVGRSVRGAKQVGFSNVNVRLLQLLLLITWHPGAHQNSW